MTLGTSSSGAPDSRLLALRGAITLEADTKDEVSQKTQRLVKEMLARNEVNHDDLVSIIFTATDDVTSEFPAAAARALGLGDVPLLCARELSIAHGMPLCVRVLMHLYSERRRDELHHVYLEGARTLRDDLPE
jgi:chorismate mutase